MCQCHNAIQVYENVSTSSRKISVADPDGSEPFWSDPDPINCPDPTIKSYESRKKFNKLNSYFLKLHFYQ